MLISGLYLKNSAKVTKIVAILTFGFFNLKFFRIDLIIEALYKQIYFNKFQTDRHRKFKKHLITKDNRNDACDLCDLCDIWIVLILGGGGVVSFAKIHNLPKSHDSCNLNK